MATKVTTTGQTTFTAKVRATGQTTFVKKIVIGTPVRSVTQQGLQFASLSDTQINNPRQNQIVLFDSAQQKFINSDSATLTHINLTGNVKSNLIPSQSDVFDLGSNNNKWKDLHLSGGEEGQSTLHLDTLQLKDSSTGLSVTDNNGLPVNINLQGSIQQIRNMFASGGDLSYNANTGIFEFDVEQVYTKANFDSDFNLALDSAALEGVGLTYNNATNTLAIDSAELEAFFKPDIRGYFTASNSLTYDNATGDFRLPQPLDSAARPTFRDLTLGLPASHHIDISGGFTRIKGIANPLKLTSDHFSRSVEIQHNESTKLKTLTTGVDVTGTINADSGTFTNLTRAATVDSATYGSASQVPVLTVNSSGFIDSIGTVNVAGVTSTSFDSASQNFTINTADGQSFVKMIHNRMPVADSGTYGSQSLVPIIRVNQYGIIDSIGSTSVAGVSSTLFDSSTGIFTINTADGNSFPTHIQVDSANFRNINVDSGTFTNINVPDNGIIKLGNDSDLTIQHTGFTGMITEKTGNLVLNNAAGYSVIVQVDNGSGSLVSGMSASGVNGKAILFYRGLPKIQTEPNGVTVTGTVNADSGTFTNITADSAVITDLSGNTLNYTSVNTPLITGPASLVIDPATVGDNTGTVQILGNLQVEGTQTVINSTTVSLNDKNIVLADSASNAAAADGAGLTINGAGATLTYAAVGDKFVFNKPFEGQYLGFDSDFDSALTTKTTTNLTEGSNLYYTDERVDDRVNTLVTDGAGITTVYDDAANTLTFSIGNDAIKDTMIDFGTGTNQVNTDDVPEGSTNEYYLKTRVDSDIAASLQDSGNVVNVTVNQTIGSTVDSAYVVARVGAAPFLDSANMSDGTFHTIRSNNILTDSGTFGNINIGRGQRTIRHMGDDFFYIEQRASGTDKPIDISNYSLGGDIKLRTSSASNVLEDAIVADGSTGISSVKLYSDGNQRLTTTDSGVTVTGNLRADSAMIGNVNIHDSGYRLAVSDTDSHGKKFAILAPGGVKPNFVMKGDGEQTFRFHNTNADPSSTKRVSFKMANRTNEDWEFIMFTDVAANGEESLKIMGRDPRNNLLIKDGVITTTGALSADSADINIISFAPASDTSRLKLSQINTFGGNILRLQNNHGVVDIGTANGSFSHFITDRTKFYFNKRLIVDESKISGYDEDTFEFFLRNSADLRLRLGDSEGVLFVQSPPLGTSLGDSLTLGEFRNTSQPMGGNTSKLRIRSIRDGNGADWTKMATRIQQRIDVTDQGYIQFNGENNTYGIELGTTGDEKFIKMIRNQAVELYYNDLKRLETGIDNVQILNVDGGASKLKVSSNNNSIGTNAAAVELYANFFRKAGLSIFGDSIGASSPTEEWFIGRPYGQSAQPLHITSNTSGEKAAVFNQAGSVELYYNNAKKLETTAYGATVTGTVNADSATLHDLNFGTMGFSGVSGFRHSSLSGTQNYAFLHGNNGTTYINASSGQQINFRIANENSGQNAKKMVFNSTGLDVNKQLKARNAIISLNDDDSTAFASLVVGERMANDGLASVEFRGQENTFSSKIDGGANYFGVWTNKNSVNNYRIIANFGTADETVILKPNGTDRITANKYGATINGTVNADSATITGFTRTGGLFSNGDIGNNQSAKGVYAGLSTAGDAQLSLVGDNTDVSPQIDFSHDVSIDYDARLILEDAGNRLSIKSHGNETMANFNGDGAVELYNDNVKVFETTASGAKIHGNTGDAVLLLEADTTNTDEADNAYIEFSQDGGLVTAKAGVGVNNNNRFDIENFVNGAGTTRLSMAGGAQTELYYGTNKKFETTAYGATVTGTMNADSATISGDITTTGSIHIGNVDTTLSRNAAGSLQIEGHTILHNSNANMPSTTSNANDADHILINDGGFLKKITPASLGIGAGGLDSAALTSPSFTGTIHASRLHLDGGTNTGEVRFSPSVTTRTTTAQGSVLNLSLSAFGAHEFTIVATRGSDRQISKLLITHDGTTAIATEYGVVMTNGRLGDYDVTINGGNLELLITSTSATSTTYRMMQISFEA